MRHIAINGITRVTADYEDGNFPASRLLDGRPGRKYKAGGLIRTATLRLYVSGGVSDFALFGTNAQEIAFSVNDPNELTLGTGLSLGTGLEIGNTEISATGTVSRRERSEALWVELDETYLRPVVITAVLTSAGSDPLYAGVAIAAPANDYGGAFPKHDSFGEGRDDSNSIEGTNTVGGWYYKFRNGKRPFSFQTRMLTSEFHRLADIFDRQGRTPTAWKLTGDDNAEFLVFGKTSISATHSYNRHVMASISIEEVK